MKNKNIRPLAGKPLLVHSIEQAKATNLFDQIAVSSDSLEILELAKSAGATCLVERPQELAQDSSPKIPAIRHCVETAEQKTNTTFDTLVDLDATSPLRAVQDIIDCIKLLESDSHTTNIITGAPARRSPYFNLVELNDQNQVSLSKKLSTPITRRQDAPRCFDMNASIYVWRRDALFANDTLFLETTKFFEMPEDRSIDIDSELDFDIVSMIMNQRTAGAS